MASLAQQITSETQVEASDNPKLLTKYGNDASIFEVYPKVITFPKSTKEVEKLVQFVKARKKDDPALSVTARSAGTDMSGGPLNNSIIVDFQKYLSKFISQEGNVATTQPGIYYRDFEKETLKHNLFLPSYPASREICTVGGMINNNSGGEKTLNYGKTDIYVESLKTVLSDGKEYEFKPLSQKQLEDKINKNNFEGEIYKKIYELILNNYDIIKKAKPDVSKNSAGYFLWNVYSKETNIFDLTQLIIGAQGTLGLVTEAKLRLVPTLKYSQMVIVYLKSLDHLGRLINEVLPLKPESFETYDDHTFKLATRYFMTFAKQMGAKNILTFTWHFLPDIVTVIASRIPKLVLQIEFASDDKKQLDQKVKTLLLKLGQFDLKTKVAPTKKSQKKYWLFRRESFNLLRHKIKERHTAPFIDDFEVKPKYLEEFLPKLNKILEKYDSLVYTIAGHIGDGNLHIIPLMDFGDPKQKQIIPKLSHEVYDLVLRYKGTITAEHNDGLIRSPFLKQMYGEKVYSLFEQIKEIFDPDNIFNPGKKIGLGIDYAIAHIRQNW